MKIWSGAIALTVAGVLFVAYPALRPFSDEKTLLAAAAYASNAWTVSHVLGMLAFVGLGLGLLSLLFALAPYRRSARLACWAVATGWVGAALTLTYYGAEAYGLRVVGRAALAAGDASLLDLVHQIRYGPGVVLFGAGLLLLAVAGVLAGAAVWRSRALPRWAGVVLALGLVLYIPQYWGTQPVRVAHGVLLAAGCIGLAVGLWRARALGRADADQAVQTELAH